MYATICKIKNYLKFLQVYKFVDSAQSYVRYDKMGRSSRNKSSSGLESFAKITKHSERGLRKFDICSFSSRLKLHLMKTCMN